MRVPSLKDDGRMPAFAVVILLEPVAIRILKSCGDVFAETEDFSSGLEAPILRSRLVLCQIYKPGIFLDESARASVRFEPWAGAQRLIGSRPGFKP